MGVIVNEKFGQKKLSSSPSQRLEDNYSASGDDMGAIGPKDTQFSPQKVDFRRDRNDWGFY